MACRPSKAPVNSSTSVCYIPMLTGVRGWVGGWVGGFVSTLFEAEGAQGKPRVVSCARSLCGVGLRRPGPSVFQQSASLLTGGLEPGGLVVKEGFPIYPLQEPGE